MPETLKQLRIDNSDLMMERLDLTKKVYGVSPSEYLRQIKLIPNFVENRTAQTENLIRKLKERYQDKPPAETFEQLRKENFDLPINSAEYWVAGYEKKLSDIFQEAGLVEKKQRTDRAGLVPGNFVPDSFLAFRIKNMKLFQLFTDLGIKMRNVKAGEFTEKMELELPSGEKLCGIGYCCDVICNGDESEYVPCFTEINSISAWLVAAIFSDFTWEDWENGEEFESCSEFSRSFMTLLKTSGLSQLDWQTSVNLAAVIADIEKNFASFDSDIETAKIEHFLQFEQDIIYFLYTEVKDGLRISASYPVPGAWVSSYKGCGMPTRGDCDGLRFAIEGKIKSFFDGEDLAKYIEDAGGSVSDTVSEETDYIICNNIHSDTSAMKRAKELGIPILSEAAFVVGFSYPDEFELFAIEWGNYGDDIRMELDTHAVEIVGENGTALDFVMEYGLYPIVTEVWKDNRWMSP